MRPLLFSGLLLFSLQGVCQEKNPIEIEGAWSRATPPGSKLAAGYMILRNKSEERVRLVSVTSPLARKVETHVTLKDGDILRMREVQGFEIPGRGRVELKPGGAHLMFIDIKQPFKEGDRIPVTLRFEKAGEMKIELEVRAAGSTGQHKMH